MKKLLILVAGLLILTSCSTNGTQSDFNQIINNTLEADSMEVIIKTNSRLESNIKMENGMIHNFKIDGDTVHNLYTNKYYEYMYPEDTRSIYNYSVNQYFMYESNWYVSSMHLPNILFHKKDILSTLYEIKDQRNVAEESKNTFSLNYNDMKITIVTDGEYVKSYTVEFNGHIVENQITNINNVSILLPSAKETIDLAPIYADILDSSYYNSFTKSVQNNDFSIYFLPDTIMIEGDNIIEISTELYSEFSIRINGVNHSTYVNDCNELPISEEEKLILIKLADYVLIQPSEVKYHIENLK